MRVYELSKFGIDNLETVERPIPEPKRSEVLVKFHAFSLNYRDLLLVNGLYYPKATFPLVPLSDGAGEIAAIGEGVTRWKVGDRVCPIFAPGWIDGELSAAKAKTAIGSGTVPGLAAAFGVFNQEALVSFPSHLSYEEAATLPCAALTAWNALVVSGKVKEGDTVLTLGTGGVSIFAVQFAKLFGAKVIATSSSDEKLGKVREIGADETINYKTREDWDNAVLELTNKTGVDHVIEVGGAGTLARSLKAVRHGGHIAVIGVVAGTGEFSPIPILMKSIRLQGIFVGSRKMFEEMNRKIESGRLKPVIDKVFKFEQLAEALKYLESGSHFGKVVLTAETRRR